MRQLTKPNRSVNHAYSDDVVYNGLKTTMSQPQLLAHCEMCLEMDRC